ncbi:glycoside hydrolase family 13 protein [Nocardia sp. NEAU-G5]|uniref:Glycoside hydrolase family 13 protein n=1 Tax=Nocardia albiluteola TaxID=2842303 RepID=A0ABS6AXF3_9NOCA|nr:glycoside hydrolase family 13 protein [Nocardia albiluteola]
MTPSSPGDPAAAAPESGACEVADADGEWWRSAVFYQVYPRSFADSNGDGVGDLGGLVDRLGYLELLGIDALWICPVMRSPMADGGYDVDDPRDIDPLFGDLAVFDELIAEAHDRGIRVTMDLVPNHTSSRHPWFTAALAAGPDSPERARYIFRDGRGPGGDQPPNNWPSIFGGPAWTRVTEADGRPGQWYLHIFAAEQPDLNWDNPEVIADFEQTMRFWLDRGVDGFRIDVAHGMAKPSGLPDMERVETKMLVHDDTDPRFNNPAVHDIHRRLRKVLDEYPGAVSIGEVWVDDNTRFGEYVRPDELHLAFNFRLAEAAYDAAEIRAAVNNSIEAVHTVGAGPTWTLSNHDIEREVTRYGGGTVGPARARAMMLLELALPGAVFVYNGSELGLPNVDDLPDEVLQDPVWERSGHTERGRDGCRVPMPWEGKRPPFGFTTAERSWLPMPAQWAELTVEAQLERLDSMLSLYRMAIELRSSRPEFAGSGLDWYGSPADCLAFRRTGGLVCALNASGAPIPLPPGEVLLASAPIEGNMLPVDAAAWLV